MASPDQLKKMAAASFVATPVASWLLAAKLGQQIDILNFSDPGSLMQSTFASPLLAGSILAGGVLGAGLSHHFMHTEPTFCGAPYHRFIRGAEFVSPARLRRKTRAGWLKKRRSGLRTQINLATIPVPIDAETRSVLLNGSTGTGKSTIMASMTYEAIMRGDRVVALDPNGDLMSRFGQPNDKILNPYDSRSQGWSIFNELRSDYDYERYVMSIIPVSKSSEGEEWAEFGRLLVREIMRKLRVTGQENIRSVLYWATEAPFEDLREFLDDTLGASLFAGSNEASRALTSARFVVSKKLTQHAKMPQGFFSLRDWLADPDGGNLWIPWREDMAPAMRPLISAWVDVICTSMLSLPETRKNERRLWLLIDELASLEKIASLLDALTKGRKTGLRMVAGLQAVSQMDSIYGDDDAQTIRANLRSLIVLGGSRTDPKTAEEMSKALGTHEVERIRRDALPGIFHADMKRPLIRETERLVTPDEIMNLPDLRAFVAFPGGYPITRVKIPLRDFPRRIRPFVEGRVFTPSRFDTMSDAEIVEMVETS